MLQSTQYVWLILLMITIQFAAADTNPLPRTTPMPAQPTTRGELPYQRNAALVIGGYFIASGLTLTYTNLSNQHTSLAPMVPFAIAVPFIVSAVKTQYHMWRIF